MDGPQSVLFWTNRVNQQHTHSYIRINNEKYRSQTRFADWQGPMQNRDSGMWPIISCFLNTD